MNNIEVKVAVPCRLNNGKPVIFFAIVKCPSDAVGTVEQDMLAVAAAKKADLDTGDNRYYAFSESDYPALFALHDWSKGDGING